MSDAVFNVVYIVSAVVLLLGMAAMEIYRWLSAKPGRIVDIKTRGGDFGVAGVRALVKLDSGEIIQATVPGCVQCMGRLRPGDRVRANATGGEFVIGLPYGPVRTAEKKAVRESRTDGAEIHDCENPGFLADGASNGRRK